MLLKLDVVGCCGCVPLWVVRGCVNASFWDSMGHCECLIPGAIWGIMNAFEAAWDFMIASSWDNIGNLQVLRGTIWGIMNISWDSKGHYECILLRLYVVLQAFLLEISMGHYERFLVSRDGSLWVLPRESRWGIMSTSWWVEMEHYERFLVSQDGALWALPGESRWSIMSASWWDKMEHYECFLVSQDGALWGLPGESRWDIMSASWWDKMGHYECFLVR